MIAIQLKERLTCQSTGKAAELTVGEYLRLQLRCKRINMSEMGALWTCCEVDNFLQEPSNNPGAHA